MSKVVLVIAVLAILIIVGCATAPYELDPVVGKDNYARITIFFATDRNRLKTKPASDMFGTGRGSLSYGTCEVSIPRDHRMGALESPSILRFEFREDPTRHVVLLEVSEQDRKKYFTDLARHIDKSNQKNAFIFVHGYNVTFADAARRTAQMAYDLAFDGAAVFYSWPSQGTKTGYLVDENNNEWTQNNLKNFLDDFTTQTDAQNIFLISHSMGSRALTRAFAQLITEKRNLRNRFREIILAAPDIDAEIFKRDIASQIIPATLYVSSGDMALTASKEFHGYSRAGDSGEQPIIVPGIETVDATSVKTDFVGHSYFAESSSIIGDMYYLMRGQRAQDRFRLQSTDTPAGRYWTLKP